MNFLYVPKNIYMDVPSVIFIFNRDDDCRSRFYYSLFFSPPSNFSKKIFFSPPSNFSKLFNFPLPTFQNLLNIFTATDGNSIICFLTETTTVSRSSSIF